MESVTQGSGTGTSETPPTGAAAMPSLASRAWLLMHQIHWREKPRFMSIGQEFDLAPQQGMALRMLGEPRTMGELASSLACDNSNVTGIVDRLEERGLVERTSDPKDRRVKLLVLTAEGRRLREEIMRRIAEPPEAIAALPRADQQQLVEILSKALDEEMGEQGTP